MWISDVAKKVWMRGFCAPLTASQALSISPFVARASPHMTGTVACSSPTGGFPISSAMRRTASRSSGEAAGKPASIMSTPRRARLRATSSFSTDVIVAPGDCSPSRKVVSKILTYLLIIKSPPRIAEITVLPITFPILRPQRADCRACLPHFRFTDGS